MNTFFSIIYIPLSANLQEKISIGLIMSNGEESIFKFSKSKLNLIKGLISGNKFTVLKNYLNNLDSEINSTSEINTAVDISQMNFDAAKSNNWVSESYFSYLNRYSNNLVIFSEPRKIEAAVVSDFFEQLFTKYVFEYDLDIGTQYKKEDIFSIVNDTLFTKIESRVNLNVTVNSADFNELLTPVDVNFLGRNGVIVAGQTMDFSKRLYNLENDLTRYISFTKAVDYSAAVRGKYFIVGKEPSKSQHPANHKIWKNVRDSHLVEYVDVQETEKIKDYIVEKGVTPFFEKE